MKTVFTITAANGSPTGIYYTNERDAQRNCRNGETVTAAQVKSRGYLHNDND
jgi:hypothetical protein